MKLDHIRLENFRQYYSQQRLNFAKDDKKRVTLIHGVNGAGKTSMFLAINWCLYGKLPDMETVGELVSKEAIERAQVGDSVTTSVDLSFLHNGERYMVRRALEGVKQDNGNFQLKNIDDFVMLRVGSDGQARKVKNPVGTMNAILPVNVREYFLFDGEKIDNFAKPEASKEIKEAIYLVLKLEVLDRAKKHLATIAKDYRKELKENSGGELRKLLEDEEKARAELDQNLTRISELKQENQKAQLHKGDILQRLREMEATKVLQKQRDSIEKSLRENRDRLQKNLVSICDLATSGYLVMLAPAIEKALQVLDEARERGEIPSNIRQQFVKDLLEQMKCICGRSIDNGSPEHKHLNRLIEVSISSTLEDDIMNMTATLKGFNDLIKRKLVDLDAENQHRVELVDIIKGFEAQLDDVRRQLKDSPEDISALEKKLEKYEADSKNNLLKIGSFTEKNESLEKKIKELKKQISMVRKEEKKLKFLSTKLDLAQQAADIISETYKVVANQMRQKIEVKTKEIFQQLAWKEGHFKDVQLDEDFNLEVIDRYDKTMKAELSAGERQVLSLSFITAMSRISEEEAPLVMDTPFGRLSEDHRNTITKHLPELADQLVFFVTDTELVGEARANVEPVVGAKYRLSFNTNNGCTEIVEVN